MRKRFSTRFLLFVAFAATTPSFAQKVKYKDLYELLRTKQYEQAEPFLKRYLAENDDNPNAFLFMGIIFQDKSTKLDVLKDTDPMLSCIDSALLFYDKAYKTIDDKELKRNKEYYEAYNRRDLRTGEYGVNLSDIQFDLEKKAEALKQLQIDIRKTKGYFTDADSLYEKCRAAFMDLQQAYPGEKEFLLRADTVNLAGLSSLSQRFDSCRTALNHYQSSLTKLGRTRYNPTFTYVPIANFKDDGASDADFFNNDLRLWDYKKFADTDGKIIHDEIIPMQQHLVTYDIEINKLREKLSQDSVSVRSDLTKLIDQLLISELRKYDPDPMPMDLFGLKIADLEYKSIEIENKPLRDSANAFLQIRLSQQELAAARKIDSLANKLNNRNLDEDVINYSTFIKNTYHSAVLLKSYIKNVAESASREYAAQQAELALRQSALNWIVDGTDSIPLTRDHPASRYKPLVVVDNQYTAGLLFTDSVSAQGYFYTITPSRLPDVKSIYNVDKANLRQSHLDSIAALASTDDGNAVFYILTYMGRKTPRQKYAATLTKIYRSDGLAWSNNLELPALPKSIALDSTSGILTITSSTGTTRVDKNGKVLAN